MTSRRARLVLVLVVLGVVGVGVFAWEPLYWWVITETVPLTVVRPLSTWNEGHRVRGRVQVRRGTHMLHGRFVTYFLETGLKSAEAEWRNDMLWRATSWNLDGKVKHQGWNRQLENNPDLADNTTAEYKLSPPWWWNATDQTAPSMPAWMKDDEQWQRALDAQD